MNNIENLSIFGNYSQNENRVTSALLQILKIGGTQFIGEVISQIDEIEFPLNQINIKTQKRENNNVYDGLLECNFSFRVIIESKIKESAINIKQLKGLLDNADKNNDYIIYITTDSKKPKELEKIEHQNKDKIFWCNWKNIISILQEKNPKTEPINFLIKEFEKYLEELNLLENINPQDRVQIVAGRVGEPIAKKYSFYACQNNRPFKESKYLAFYNNGGIYSLFEIVEPPKNDYDLKQNDELKDYLDKYEPHYERGDKRQFYKLKFLKELNIKHSGKNRNGNKSAYTMGVFRYTSIDKINSAKDTNEL